MTVKHKEQYIEVYFKNEDFKRRLAQKAIEHIKLLGSGNYFYEPPLKRWKVLNTPFNRRHLREFRDRWIKDHFDQSDQLRLNLDEFNVDSWLNSTFPK